MIIETPTHEEEAADTPFETICYWEEQYDALASVLLRVWLPPELTAAMHAALARQITTRFAGLIAVLQRPIAATWDGPTLTGTEAPRRLQALRERVGDELYAEIVAASGMDAGPASEAEAVGLLAALQIWLDNPVLAGTPELRTAEGGMELWVSRGYSDAACPVCGRAP